MKIPILNGIFADSEAALKTSYPINLMPVVQENGISEGYLRPVDGITLQTTGSGVCRGGINWNGTLYRVLGSSLVSISKAGVITVLGDVGDNGIPVTMEYSFDRLAIASNGNLFYWNGAALTQVTDPDLGNVVDLTWVDGYFMTTDGEFLVITELNDPTSIDPLKYGSSEIDPDPVTALLKVRNEVQALNRYTIESFRNVGGTGFPFQRIEGAQIQKGCTGPDACCTYMDAIAFLGSGRNEQCSIYIGQNGGTVRVSSNAIDAMLEEYTEEQLSKAVLETRNDRGNMLLFVHLPDRTLVYDQAVSAVAQDYAWHVLSSGAQEYSRYLGIFFVYAYDRWNIGDPTTGRIGYLDSSLGSHWGVAVGWEFGTQILYNESRGAIFSELELVAVTGRIPHGSSPIISTSYSNDGVTWSQDRSISAGVGGDRTKRLVWFRQGSMESMRTQRFRGDSAAHVSFLRLEARIEPLN